MVARREDELAARAANLVFALTGLILVGAALAAGRPWLDAHFLPTFTWPRATQIRIVDTLRAIVAAIGLLVLLTLRPRMVRAIRAGRGRDMIVLTVSVAVAIVAAFGTAELVLRSRTWRSNQEQWAAKEPLRRRDARLGWASAPDHHGQARIGGRIVDYASNGFGYRVRAVGDRIDFRRPTIVFAGESILHGYGLQQDETAAALVERATGIQTANISVNAYANDQAYLRLKEELPRFARPVAVITLFMPILFDRDLDEDRPHLDSGLNWHPAEPPPLRLVELTRRVIRYRSTAAIARGTAMTRAALAATLRLAEARGAAGLIVVPIFTPEEPIERTVRQQVLDSAHLPYLPVAIPSSWRIPGDRHPDARGDRLIAAAIVAALKARGS